MKLTKLGKLVFTIILIVAVVFTYNAIGTLGTLAQENDLYLSLDVAAIVIMFLEILAIGKIYEK